MLHLGFFVGSYDHGIAIIDCRDSIYMVGLAESDDDAAAIVEDVKGMIRNVYPGLNK